MTTLLWVPVALPPALMVVLLLLDALDRRLPPGHGAAGRSAPPPSGDVPVRSTARIERFEDAPAT
ncbi:hypothetical protein [Actinomycetospora straminea]|uniref:Uncharacterized protein n=1 Tax=Actinomycetospora straminea TaxID=663607 RepID=A0ABP9ET61_9PSEU|nr:hypothetical protein [Actinomycetospora straminea]MDD7933158.1 hypothetical protein [Actinomycetospora straminea]